MPDSIHLDALDTVHDLIVFHHGRSEREGVPAISTC
jgi:hypothetical protein